MPSALDFAKFVVQPEEFEKGRAAIVPEIAMIKETTAAKEKKETE